ncbi:hypothetical protein K7W42_12180 [Deinococcus sp. HMF7604]|uniref:hypothetical protein n=1 Tax=Deinococcus betulae TaxID=2873312 RepID=UPI001CCDC6D1|nr:hypothetical protein [Deinococcus betulae]MBZ9751624.1 hypothetical protein [Deinococcus betulae]
MTSFAPLASQAPDSTLRVIMFSAYFRFFEALFDLNTPLFLSDNGRGEEGLWKVSARFQG